MTESVDARPTKSFFVEMLTRDIDLIDAILDLLDNCVDGIQRNHNISSNNDIPYDGYFAKINFNNQMFSIRDNCGGIPKDVALKYALRMGRPSQSEGGPPLDNGLFVIGTYGIGMKRAIFKMGHKSQIISQTQDCRFKVEINPDWLISDSWELGLDVCDRMTDQDNGTSIEITNLHQNIAQSFTSTNTLNDLFDKIAQNYSYIISKGFKVFLNDKLVEPKPFALLWDESADTEKHLAPYVYSGKIGEIEVRLIIGFHRNLPTKVEEDEEAQGKRWSSTDAGWTIICNDRVVLYCDKTRLTGWGEENIPSYHTQFIAISGIVEFKCSNPNLLPITTTKRGIDASSDIYLYIKKYMREGLKLFTKYTYDLKKNNISNKQVTANAKTVAIEPQKVVSKLSSTNSFSTIKVRGHADGSEEKKYIPPLPKVKEKPQEEQIEWIKFSKPHNSIKYLAENFLEDLNAKPSDVGSACFDFTLKQVMK